MGADERGTSPVALVTSADRSIGFDVCFVNAVCPSLVETSPTAQAAGGHPAPEGAASVVWATTFPDDGPTGGFFRDGEPLS
jgi:hypothetical protein